MRLIKQAIDRDGSGVVTLLPEDPEDMWSAYNLIRPSDKLRASAVRRIVNESATGTTTSHRVHTNFTVKVTSTSFDAQAASLHVSGQIAEESQYAKLGQFHTLDLELNRQFSIEKADGWDSVAIQIVRDAVDVTKGASAWAVIMQEGLAHICVLTGDRTVLRQKVEVAIPRKRVAGAGGSGGGGGSGKDSAHDKALAGFFQKTLDTLVRQIDPDEQLPILLASPGFTAQAFHKFAVGELTRSGNKALQAQTKNMVVAHSTSGYLHALGEVLQSPAVLTRLKDTKYARETKLMDEFMMLLRRDDGRAWYGPREVEAAVEKGAVGPGGGVLFVSNSLFRSLDVAERRRWVRLVDRVRDVEGGEVRILSSEHESGKRLEGLGGVAAILTFPLTDLTDEVEQDEHDNDELGQV